MFEFDGFDSPTGIYNDWLAPMESPSGYEDSFSGGTQEWMDPMHGVTGYESEPAELINPSEPLPDPITDALLTPGQDALTWELPSHDIYGNPL